MVQNKKNIKSKTSNSDDYDEKCMKIKINSDDDLPLKKMLEPCNMIIFVRYVFMWAANMTHNIS